MNQFLGKYQKTLITVVPVIAIVLLCVLTGTMFFMEKKMTEMENQLGYLIDTNSILQSQMTNLQSNIELTLEEEASFMETLSIEVVETDFSKGTYMVKISVVPKEYSEATRVSVFFGTWEIPLTLNRYAYEGMVELSLANNYDGNVAFLFVNGGKRNTEVLKNYEGLQTKLKDLLYGSIPEIPKVKDGKLYFDQEISYTLNTYEDYGYETLELVLMANEEERVVVNLLESYAKEKESTENPRTNASANPQMVYGLSGARVLKEALGVEDGQKVRLFLRAKCENGYRLEYDLFSAVVEAEGPNGFAETKDYFVENYCVYDKNGNKYEMK